MSIVATHYYFPGEGLIAYPAGKILNVLMMQKKKKSVFSKYIPQCSSKKSSKTICSSSTLQSLRSAEGKVQRVLGPEWEALCVGVQQGGGIVVLVSESQCHGGQQSGVRHHRSEAKSTSVIESEILWHPFQKGKLGNLPGRPIVKTRHFNCWVCGFDPWLGS